MNFKKKIKGLQVEYEDGTHLNYSGSAIHNCSHNWRSKYGQPYAEWIENVITWHESPTVPVYLKAAKQDDSEPELQNDLPDEQRSFRAWCNQHKCEPTECFRLHNPTAYSGRPAVYQPIEVSEPVVVQIPQKQWDDFIADFLEGYSNGHSAM